MATNHVEGLAPGGGVYALFLNAQGRILADANILCLPDAFLIDTEPETAHSLYEHLDRYIIADDVTLLDQTATVAVLGVEGPATPDIAGRLGLDLPDRGGWTEWNGWIAARISAAGADGLRIFAPSIEKDRVISWLAGLGLVEAGEPELRVVRLENAHPRFGLDFSSRYIPHETQLLHAIHFSKGCYLGQEIVERVRSRGLVNRKLVQLLIDTREAPAPETKIMAGDAEAGEITSAAWSPALERTAALGYIRVAAMTSPLTVAGSRAGITNRTPA
jgi:folate-binding protein YgfZ